MSKEFFLNYHVRPSGVAILTLDNPPLNLTTLTTLDRLSDACLQITKDKHIRAVVITGVGDKAFCAGSDIKEFSEVMDDVVEKKLRLENRTFTALEQLPVPVIAALNGITLGGGAEIALACDIRIMASTARIGFPEIKLGVFPGSGGVFRLPRLIGPAKAYEMLYTGDTIDAGEAFRIGLVNRIVSPDTVLNEAMAFAETVTAGPALALTAIRKGVRAAAHETTSHATKRTLADSHKVFTAPDATEGVSAFFDKRQPLFKRERDNQLNCYGETGE